MLSSTKCGDGKMVVNVYTREEGKRGFLVRLPSSSAGKGRMKASFFFPLSQIEATFSEPRQGQDLVYLNDVKVVYAYREMYTDIRKSSVACFLAEVMGRCILQSEQDIRFYDTVATALRQFDAFLAFGAVFVNHDIHGLGVGAGHGGEQHEKRDAGVGV